MEVIPDTNIFISALCFPDSMGAEIVDAARKEQFVLLLPEYVVLETERVIERDFPDHTQNVEQVTAEFQRVRGLPYQDSVKKCQALINDPKDAPVLATVTDVQPDIFITGDINDFHTEAVKDHLQSHDVELRTPYRFLQIINRR